MWHFDLEKLWGVSVECEGKQMLANRYNEGTFAENILPLQDTFEAHIINIF